MTLDLMGVAAIVGAIGVPLTVVFGQYNTRRAIRDAAAAAKADAARVIAAADAAHRAADTAVQIAVSATEAVDAVHKAVNGGKAADLKEIVALRGEVTRLQNPESTTPAIDARVTLDPATGTVAVHAAAAAPADRVGKRERSDDTGDG